MYNRNQSVAEAACAEVVRVADAAKEDCLDCLAIFDAAQIREEDAERAPTNYLRNMVSAWV